MVKIRIIMCPNLTLDLIQFVLCLAWKSIKMNETTNFVTYAYLKKKCIHQDMKCLKFSKGDYSCKRYRRLPFYYLKDGQRVTNSNQVFLSFYHLLS